jgi:hypothetical protein
MTPARATIAEGGGRLGQWLRGWGAALAAVPGVALWVHAVMGYPVGGGPPPYLGPMLALFWAGPAVWLAGLLQQRQRVAGTFEVRVEADALVLAPVAGGEPRRIPRDEIAQASMNEAGALVVELAGGRELTVALEPERARELLEALELAPGQRRAVFRWRPRRAMALGALVGLALPLVALLIARTPAVGALTVPIVSGIPWLLAAWLGQLASAHRLTVGADGIELSARGSRRRVRFADVAEVRSSARGLELVLDDGAVELLVGPREDARQREVLKRWIDEALARARARAAARRPIDLPAADDGFEAFCQASARVIPNAVDFRTRDVSADDVGAIVDDPLGAPEQRIAAALALAASGSPEARRRVRVAAEASVSPKLRIALDAAADAELEEEMLEDARREAQRR